MTRFSTLSTAFVGLFLLFISGSLSAQVTIVEYPLTTDGNASVEDAHVSTTALNVGPSNGSMAFNSNGAASSSWAQTSTIDEDHYFVVSITPNTGFEMNISEIDFGYRRSGTGPLEYELYWSTDGVLANSTLIDAVTMASNTDNQIGSVSGLNIDIAEGETLYLKWYAFDASSAGGTWRIDVNTTNLKVVGTVTTTSTITHFANSGATVNEDDGTTSIGVSIINEHTIATSVDVVLVSGDATRVNGFTSQTVVFPANSSADQSVTITLTDDVDCELDGELVFELQNVTGGDNAQAGAPAQFALNILDDEATPQTYYSNDFEAGNLNEWTQGADGDWTTSASGAINTTSLKHNLSGVAGTSIISTSIESLDLNQSNTTWRFQMKNGNWDPSGGNKFWVHLISSQSNFEAASTGYAVGVNMDGSTDLLTLYRVETGGSKTAILISALDWDAAQTVGIEVVRNTDGDWTLLHDDDGGFDNLVSAGSINDVTYTTAGFFGAEFEYSATRAGEFWVDDIEISQTVCGFTYYSQESGDMAADVWDTQTTGTSGSATYSRFNSFVVQDGHTITLDADLEINDFTIDTGGIMELGITAQNLSVAGNWTNNGTLDAGDGKVSFVGESASAIAGNNSFFDLEVNLQNVAVTMNNDMDLSGTLYLHNGTLDVDGNTLTLISNSTTTAAVAPVTNGAVTGNVTVERYIADGATSWRNMGAAVSGATLQEWNKHFTTTGFPGSDFPNWPSASNRFPNIKSYDETDLGHREIGWRSPTGTSNVIGDGQGYWMYIGTSELPKTVDVTGSLITGDKTLNLDYTPNLGSFHDGWNLISNVYAATIDWDSPDFTRSGLEGAIQIWNESVQQYGAYISGVGTHSVSNEIAHSQSFWVHADAASPSITFKEAIKSANNNALWIKSTAVENQSIIRIQIAGNGYTDETVIALNDDATSGYEGTHDAMKFYSINEDAPGIATVLYTDTDTTDLSINSISKNVGDQVSILMKAPVSADGTYTLSITEFKNVDESACLVLEDLETGDVMPLLLGEEMTVELAEGVNEPRFVIHLAGGLITEKQDNSCHGHNDGWIMAEGSGDGPWTYTWTNEFDEVVRVSESIYTADILDNLTSGAYTVSVAGNNVYCAESAKQLFISQPLAQIAELSQTAPSCNEGSNGEISVLLLNGTESWTVSLYDENDGLVATQENVENAATFENLAAGNYTLFSENSCGVVEDNIALFDEYLTTAAFDMSATEVLIEEGGMVELTNTSQNGETYVWEMGDGTLYFTENATHAYAEIGIYTIKLYSINANCDSETEKEFTVTSVVGVADNDNSEQMKVWYDGDRVVIEHNLANVETDIHVVNILGKTILTQQSTGTRIEIPISSADFAAGVYFINIRAGAELIKTHKFAIGK